MSKKPYYITTPIYYPSGNPHIGHCYTTVACDSIARYRRMQGYDVIFLTGTDEHGLKIEQKAAAKGITPKEYVDEIVKTFKALWEKMHVSYDRYIRTTDDYHIETVQKIFKRLYDLGYIYKGEYKGKYCTPCESFWTESQLDENGCCPECHREVVEQSVSKSCCWKPTISSPRPVQWNWSTTSSSRGWKTSAFPAPLSHGAFRSLSIRSTWSMSG